MHIRYDDITDRIAEAPVWWLDGIPRYRNFMPDDLSVYAQEVILMRVECQMCFRKFDVGQFYPNRRQSEDQLPLRDDPPSHASDVEEDCGGGSMGATELQIMQFWKRSASQSWVRDKDREVVFDEPMLPD